MYHAGSLHLFTCHYCGQPLIYDREVERQGEWVEVCFTCRNDHLEFRYVSSDLAATLQAKAEEHRRKTMTTGRT